MEIDWFPTLNFDPMIFMLLKGCKAFEGQNIYGCVDFSGWEKPFNLLRPRYSLAKVWYFSKDGMLLMDRKTCQNMSVNCAIH